MNVDLINTIIKTFFTGIFMYIIYMKLINNKYPKKKNIIIMILISIALSVVYIKMKFYVNSIFAIFLVYFFLSNCFAVLAKQSIGYSMVITLVAIALYFLTFILSTVFVFFPYRIFNINNNIINSLIITFIQFMFIHAFFKIKRFKNGIAFLQNKKKNDYLDIVMINISALVILAYCIFGNYYGDNLTKYIFFTFIVVGVIMVIMIQKTLILNYKQKLVENTINDYEDKIKEKDNEIEKLTFNISKTTHEFYNRQKALEMMVKNTNIEAGQEFVVLDRIENLTQEYSEKLKKVSKLSELQLTNITEIDEMLKYMQAECYKNNIEFKLKVIGDIHYLINNIIAKNKFVTLIGDHLRDAIMAITSSVNKNREILVIMGTKNKSYELCIYDTGVEFEVEVLQRLGLKPITTHKEIGGSGIGFMTTFETLKECKGSIIIEEKHKMIDNDFTKAVIIRFDGKNEYKIKSYRADEIRKQSNDNRIIIEDL